MIEKIATDLDITKLNDLIESKRMKRLELSKASNVNYNTLSQYLNGYMKLSTELYDKLYKIVDNFKI